MSTASSLDWPSIRSRAAMFPEEAFEFIREGLRHTVQTMHCSGKTPTASAEHASDLIADSDDRRHISGQQLCIGLRDLAIERYGMLARTVLNRWGVRKTEDFGTLVYAMIDRSELRVGENDSIADFNNVYDFVEAFAELPLN